MTDNTELEEHIAHIAQLLGAARAEIGRVLVGQRYLVDRLFVGLLSNGHVLVEGVPGLAKTTAIKALADSLDLEFGRIQFTPDLLPADVIGTQMYQPATSAFTTHKGPVFTHVLLADEINRSPAKVQSALLQAMQERQVTIGETTWSLPQPFLVLATQNPIEQEGTYPLPEAQADRFMLKLSVSYPDLDDELEIIRRSALPIAQPTPKASLDELLQAQQVAREIHVAEPLMRYIVDVVRATRDPGSIDASLARSIEYGASPRASIALAAAARAYALLDGRTFALPEDVKAMAPDVLRHRILPTYEAEADGIDAEALVAQILNSVEMH